MVQWTRGYGALDGRLVANNQQYGADDGNADREERQHGYCGADEISARPDAIDEIADGAVALGLKRASGSFYHPSPAIRRKTEVALPYQFAERTDVVARLGRKIAELDYDGIAVGARHYHFRGEASVRITLLVHLADAQGDGDYEPLDILILPGQFHRTKELGDEIRVAVELAGPEVSGEGAAFAAANEPLLELEAFPAGFAVAHENLDCGGKR